MRARRVRAYPPGRIQTDRSGPPVTVANAPYRDVPRGLLEFAKDNPYEAGLLAASMSGAEPVATIADGLLTIKETKDAYDKEGLWPAIKTGAIGTALTALPFVGMGAVKAVRGGADIPIVGVPKNPGPGKDIRVEQKGASTWDAWMGDEFAGVLNTARGGPFVSSVVVEPKFRRQGVGRALYSAAESGLGRRLVPSPLGLSPEAQNMWVARLSGMAPDDAASLLDESLRAGRSYGIPDADIETRLGPLRGLLGDGPQMSADLPMDEASRMARADEVLRVPGGRAGAFDSARANAAKPVNEGGLGLPPDNTAEMRARAMGFDVDAFHASRATEPFDAFRPGMWGSTYLAATPNRAVNGASAGAQELAHLSSPTDGRAAVSIMPLKVRGDDIATLRPPRDAWDALPDTAKESDIGDLARKVGASHWWDVYDEVAIKPPKWDEADKLIDAGEFEYRKRPYPAQEYTAGAKPWQDSERLLPGYNSGSDVSSLARVARDGQRGFLVADEAGASIVAGPGMPIRSRFAAFDPKNINSSDLLAGIAGAGLLGIGARAAMPSEDERGLLY